MVLVLLFLLCVSITFPVLLLQKVLAINDVSAISDSIQLQNMLLSIISINSIVLGVFFIVSIIAIDFIFTYKGNYNIIVREKYSLILFYIILMICSAILTMCLPSIYKNLDFATENEFQFLYFGTLMSIFGSMMLIIIYSMSCDKCNFSHKGVVNEIIHESGKELEMITTLDIKPENIDLENTPRTSIRSPRRGSIRM